MENNLVYNSNKAMVSYLIKNGCRCYDVKLGYNDTLLFGFDKTETYLLAKVWFDRAEAEPSKSKV